PPPDLHHERRRLRLEASHLVEGGDALEPELGKNPDVTLDGDHRPTQTSPRTVPRGRGRVTQGGEVRGSAIRESAAAHAPGSGIQPAEVIICVWRGRPPT